MNSDKEHKDIENKEKLTHDHECIAVILKTYLICHISPLAVGDVQQAIGVINYQYVYVFDSLLYYYL